MKWILVVMWLTPIHHFSIEFDSAFTCDVAKQTIELDIERDRLEKEQYIPHGIRYTPRYSVKCLPKQ